MGMNDSEEDEELICTGITSIPSHRLLLPSFPPLLLEFINIVGECFYLSIYSQICSEFNLHRFSVSFRWLNSFPLLTYQHFQFGLFFWTKKRKWRLNSCNFPFISKLDLSNLDQRPKIEFEFHFIWIFARIKLIMRVCDILCSLQFTQSTSDSFSALPHNNHREA